MNGKVRGSLLLLSLVGALALIVAPSASAHMVDVVGGKTKLTVHAKLKKKLAKHDSRLRGTKYDVTKGEYSFHALNDGGGGGISHKGSLRFRSPDGAVKFGRLRLIVPPLDDHLPLGVPKPDAPRVAAPFVVAKVDGKDVVVANLGTRRYEVTNDYPGFTGLEMKLNGKGARILNRLLDVGFFKQGTKIGELSNRSKIAEAH